MKAAHIADLRHELRAERRPNAVHLHHDGILGQSGSQALHLFLQGSQRSRRSLKLGNGLLDYEFGTVAFRHDADMSASGYVDIKRLVLAEVVAVLTAPFLIALGKGLYAHVANALAVPVLRDEIYPLLAAIGSRWAGKELVGIRKGDVEQRDKIVLLHSSHLAELLILTVTGFQHEPGVSGGEIPGKSEPMIQSVVRQLDGVLLVSLGSA